MGVPVLPREFYARPTLHVSRDLIGKTLVHLTTEGRIAGQIVEVEAYVGESDPACHAASGLTSRNAPLYGWPGRAYIYLNYGIHHLVNAVTEPEGAPAAVLIRAVQPTDGLELMRRRRRQSDGKVRVPGELSAEHLCRGPGNLSRAFGLTRHHNRLDLCGGRLFVEDTKGGTFSQLAIEWTPRIGIRVGVERPWRCALAGSPYVSGR